ncbi:MAG: hypothetical protein SFU56_03930 [Capsulimonadales bacterium]|nr:hypothetical protein [Capsulimonadales bacterium]
MIGWHRFLGRLVRLAGMGAVGVFSALLLFQVALKILHPYRLGQEEARKVEALRHRLEARNAENQRLERRLEYLKSPEGQETLARRAGFHRNGEIPFLLTPAAVSSEASADSDAPENKP